MADQTAQLSDVSQNGWLATAKRVKDEIANDNVGLIAAGCAFYALMAIFPGIVAVMAVAGLFAEPASVVDQMQTLVGVLPAEAADIVIEQAKSVAGSDETGLGLAALLGLGIALYSASAGIGAVMQGLNVAFDVEEDRSFVKALLVRLGLTLATIIGGLLVMAALVLLPIVLGFVQLGNLPEMLMTVLRWPLVLLFLVGGLAVLYQYGPNRSDREWRWITPGAAIACLLWLAGSLAFAWYVQNFGSYNETFGTLGGVIILLMWFWLSSYIVLMGAEIDAELEAQAKQNPKPESPAPETADADRLPN